MTSSPGPFLQVALDTPLEQVFDYLAPDAGPADVGRRVRVPFGTRERTGVATGIAETASVAAEQIRAVIGIDRDTPGLPADILQLARFAADYYHHPLGQVLAALLPPALKRAAFRRPPDRAYALTAAGRDHVRTLPARALAQRRLADLLAAGPVAAAAVAGLRAPLRRWLEAGYVEAVAPGAGAADAELPPPLTADQADALRALLDHPAGFAAWLLHGVTGSGKTEVYLRLVGRALEEGLQVLILAPEIHLTPQLAERFRRRFPGRVLVSLHSGMSDGERLAGWLDCARGDADIVLGTRLAVFTPLPRLGLIIVDEEHDASYKQMEGLRYHARDVAIWRARQRDIPVVLGSATPALESWANAARGRYRLVTLPERARAEAGLPEVRLVDVRVDKAAHGLSGTLRKALAECLERGEQSLVFINRRGYAPVLYCRACGHVSQCPRCSAHQVIHRAGQGYQLRCHHCGLAARPPESCPVCGSMDLRPAGQGTQRLEATLAELFPTARILRIDRDSAGRKGAFAAMREAIEARRVDILVGTQIVAKGHDFPHLTLVGVVGADQALMSTDFRAGERLFAQLMQVGGRAGRAERPGRVLVQTEFPHHPLYAALVAHDYPAFAARALAERREAEFPPYSFQALLRAEAPSMAEALAFLEHARSLAGDGHKGVALFDPVPALMPRVAERERAQLLAQSASRTRLRSFLAPWVSRLRESRTGRLRWSIDVDPQDG